MYVFLIPRRIKMPMPSQTISGENQNPTQQKIHSEIDNFLNKSEGFSHTTSKTASYGIISTVFSSIASTMRYIGLPEAIYKTVGSLGGAKVAEYSDLIANYSAKTSTQVTREILHRSADSSMNSSNSLYNYITSWFR